VLLFVISVFAPLFTVRAAPFISQKWVRTGLPKGEAGVLTANLDGDAYDEIIMAGNNTAGMGEVVCLDGQTGAVQWRYTNNAIGELCQPQMADLDSDGTFEIIVPVELPPAVVVLHSNGAVWWQVSLSGGGREGSITCSPVVADIDGNGYSTIFVGREDAIEPLNGGIAAISWDGKIIAETFIYRPCAGGFSLADVDNNGVFELFVGDRHTGYHELASGVWCLNAHTLETIWKRPEILSSSYCPILADVTGDGILDVIAHNHGGGNIYVLNALTGATIRQASVGAPTHYQFSVYDIDRDGNLELITADGSHSYTPEYVLIWDLVAWKEDARLYPGLCFYAPQVGEVTGDGYMDIIACNYTGVFIYSYNPVSETYDLVDQITGLSGWLTYAVVQDIDNDGLNEIIVQSMGNRVYCFDTVAPRPSLRARSEVQFYSERRLGAAEYVPPPSPDEPIISNPSPANGQAFVPLNLTELSFRIIDYQDDLMQYTVTTNPDIGGGSGSGYDGNYSVPVSNLQPEITYTWQVSVTAGTDTTLATYNFTTKSSASYDDVVFDSSFDMGNMNNAVYVGGDASGFREYTGEQEHVRPVGAVANQFPFPDKHWWFYFSMGNVAGKTVKFTFVNNEAVDFSTSPTSGNRWPNIEPVYSYDNLNWERVPLTGISFDRTLATYTITFTVPPTQSKVWLAPIPPYNIEKRDALFTEFALSPYLTVTSLGTTPGGQQLKVATITDHDYADANKFKSYVIAQQHGGEVPGSWNVDGLIRYLLSDDPTAAAIRRSYIFKIIPIVNVDGVYEGVSRYTSIVGRVAQYDLNRDWTARTQPEVQWIWADLLAFQPDSFNDMHSTINTEVSGTTPEEALTYTWSTSDPTIIAFRAKVKTGGWPETVTGTTSYAATVVHNSAALGNIKESVSWENPHDELRTNPGVKLTVNDWRAWGAGWAKGNYLYFGTANGTLTTSTDGDGTVSKDPDQATYPYGTNVELTATPASADWVFAGWSGNLTGMANPATIVINGTLSVTAHFVPAGVNVPPSITAPQPTGGAVNVPLSTSLLNFTITDFNGDLMDYYVSTMPDVGSGSAVGVSDGTYSVAVSGLSYGQTYTWWVNVTDGTGWTNSSFTFTAEFIPLTINTSFESASIGSYTINGDQIDLTIYGEPVVNTPGTIYTYWTYFEVSNVQDRAVTFRVTNAVDIDFLTVTSQERQLVYSYDGENWLRFPTGTYSGGVYTFGTTFTGGNDVYVATFYPFTYTEMNDYIDSIDPSPYVEASVLGLSEQGREIRLVKITNTAIPESEKETIYIIGRQHAAETCSSFMIRGLIDFLLTEDEVAQRSRDAFVYYIVPMVNPDGVVLGKSRVTSENRDANRDWHATVFETAEVNVVRASIDAVDASNGIDFFIDWHSQMDDTSWSNFVYSPIGNTFDDILIAWTDFDRDVESGYSYPTDSCSNRGYVMTITQPGYMATVEPTPHLTAWTIASLEEQGMLMAHAINEYYPDTFTITASAGAGGSITPSGDVIVAGGDSQLFTITLDANYAVEDVLVDGTSVGAVIEYTFTSVWADHSISVSFISSVTHTIAASAGAGGSITPSGSVIVAEGADQLFTITPLGGYEVADVLVDDVSVGPVPSYTFTGVTADHTISVSFDVLPLIVDSEFDASADSTDLRTNGAGQDWYESRGTLASALTLDENNVAGNTGKKAALKTYSDTSTNSVYLTQELSSPQTGSFSVSFDINIDQIFLDSQNLCRGAYIFLGDAQGTTTPNAGGARRFVQLAFWDSTPGTDGDMKLVAREENNNDGTAPHDPWLDPSTWNEVATGLSYDTWYTIRIDVHFVAGTRGSYDVYVNGVLAKAGIIGYEQYVSASITHISFAIGGVSTTGFGRGDFYVDNVFSPAEDRYKLTVGVDGFGSVDVVPGESSYAAGAEVTLTATADLGYLFDHWTVDGSPIVSGEVYVVIMDADHAVTAYFVEGVTYTITASAGAGGSIVPVGAVVVDDGADQSFTIAADTGYEIADVLVDGLSVGAVEEYTFYSVSKDCTIEASFSLAPITWTITAFAGSGGSIDPVGAVVVADGADQTFTITPDTGYLIAEILVDGDPQVVASEYTFYDVIGDHTISVSFSLAPLLVDSEFSNSADSADLRTNGAGQDWYESRNDLPTLLTLDTDNVGGNTGKKASLKNYGVANNVYLTQEFSSAQTGTFSVSFDMYIDRIEDNANYDRTGHIFIGNDWNANGIPLDTARERYVLLAFYDSTPSTDGDLQLRARTLSTTAQSWTNTGLWPTVASGLSYDTWYTIKVTVNYVAGTYDVTFNGVTTTFSKMDIYSTATDPAISFISFMADSAAKGDFYVDNVFSPAVDRFQLTVNKEGSGSVSRSPGESTYAYNSVVQLTAVPADGWSFSGWSGDASGTELTTSVTMTGNKSVTATFAQDEYTLAVNVIGSGSVVKSPEQATYHWGDVVTLTPSAADGWTFDGWTGDYVGSDDPLVLTIYGDVSLTATFSAIEYTLTVNTVGSGSVVRVPDRATYHYGDSVTLTATAASGWSFDSATGWSDDGTTDGSGNRVVSITGDMTVTATFIQDEYTLSITTSGSGSVSKDPDQLTYHYGDVVQLTAVPVAGWSFSAWSGDVVSSDNPVQVTMNGDKSITAAFSLVPVTWTITASAGTGGSITPSGAVTVADGGSQSFTIAADTGYVIADVLVDGSSVGAVSVYPFTNVVTDHTIAASFELKPYLFADGFESGSFSAWSGVSGVPVVQTAIKHDGVYAMRAAASGRACYLTVSESTVHMRAYFYFDSAGGSVQLMRFRAGSTALAVLVRTATGALQLGYRSGSSLVYVTGALTMSLDRWYCVELRMAVGASGEYSVWLDGVEIGAFHITGVDNDNYGVVTRVDVGCVYASSTVDVYVDCAVVSKTYIGPEGAPTQYSLTVSVVGSGSVTKVPDQASYASGTVVTLTAVPDIGWSFSAWSGALSGSTNPTTITMDSDKAVTATFVESVYLFADGFESGSFSAWSGVSGVPVVQTAIKHDGVYAMRAAASGRACYLTVSESAVHMRAYVYVDSAAGSVQLMRFRAGSTALAVLIRTASGALQLAYRNGGSLVYVTSGTVLSLDAWHCIELRTVVGASGEYSVWLDGVEVSALTITGVDNDNYGVITRVDVGCIYSSSTTVDVYVDSAVVSDSYIGT
jgi:uncharacterized repeat protein (TIGR02543 family)